MRAWNFMIFIFGAILLLIGATSRGASAQGASAESAPPKVVHYELVATRGQVNLSGKKTVDFALMLNGSIPAPKLEFTEGDTAEIVVKNQIPNEELSIHWHGILLPPEMDGVAYVNSPPILPGQSFTFRFNIRQHGTYWYHSHTNVQEQKGLFGPFIIHERKKEIAYDRDVVAIISDWSDEDALDILKNLKKDGDYYLRKKGTVRSIFGAIQAGRLGIYIDNEWTRMGGMDYSDVGYDAFLINGKRELQLLDAHPGERIRIRIRIINASASTYFHVSLGQTPMKVISADGIDIEPKMANEILMGMAETYDVLFEVPEHKNYELRATAQDGTGAASGWIGMGEKVAAPVKPAPDLYAPMDHGGHGGGHGGHGGHSGAGDHAQHGAPAAAEHADHSMHSGHGTPVAAEHTGHDAHADHSGHSMHSGHGAHSGAGVPQAPTVETLTVDELRAQEPTTLPKNAPVHDVKLVLDGDMSRYVWHINGKAIHEDRTIVINEGDVVRFTFVNETMMHHPMHLHGHFFRVVNQNGDYSPLKHTVDVGPHMTRVIEFLANEPGEWMLHCHNLYHMKTGMARVVKYSSYTPKPEIAKHQKHDPHLHDHRYWYGSLEAATSHAQAYLRLSNTWNQLEARVSGANLAEGAFAFGKKWEYEGDLFYRRWFGKYLNVILGGTSYNQQENFVAGVGYKLPLLIESNVLINQRGKFRLDLEKRFQWTSAIYSDIDFKWRPDQDGPHEAEFEATLMYSPTWAWAGGLMLTNNGLGAGAQFQF